MNALKKPRVEHMGPPRVDTRPDSGLIQIMELITMKRLAIAVCAVSMLTACAEGPSRNVWTGAAAGAILGAGQVRLLVAMMAATLPSVLLWAPSQAPLSATTWTSRKPSCASKPPAPASVLSARATRSR